MKQLCTIAVLVVMAGTLHAKIWRVNNNPKISANYTSLQAAIYKAASGDTIYVEGSSASYTNPNGKGFIYLTKPLVLVGPGYFLSLNDSTLSKKVPAHIYDNISLYPAAKGSVLQGLELEGTVHVGCSDVMINRNNISGTLFFGYYRDSLCTTSVNNHSSSVSNIIVSQNYISTAMSTYYGTAISSVISNNIINTNINFGNANEFIIANNCVTSSINVHNSTVINNICGNTITTGQNNTVEANSSSVNESLFYVMGTVPDKKFMLLDNSPARGNASDGGDQGAFGGNNPYVLSGLPPIPHIYELSAPINGSSSSGLPVKIKVKTQN